MAKENVAEVAAVRAGEQALEEYLDRESKPMLDASGEEIVRVLGDLVSEADRRAVTPELGDFMAEDCKRALAAGVWGWFDDDRAIFADWGFDLLDVRVPLSIWHGAQDRFVPIAHGEWLAAHLPARAHLRPDDGHLSLTVTAYGEILDALLEP
jgi:pimeloyl-ACP methyl ester carboxylesterase